MIARMHLIKRENCFFIGLSAFVLGLFFNFELLVRLAMILLLMVFINDIVRLKIYKKVQKLRTGFELPLLLVLITYTASVCFSPYIEGIGPLTKLRWVLLIYILFWSIRKSNYFASIKPYGKLLFACLILYFCYSLAQFLFGINWFYPQYSVGKMAPFAHRILGLTNNPIAVASFMTMLIPFSLAFIAVDTKNKKFWLSSFIFILAIIFFSYTRGAWLSVFIVLSMMLIYNYKKKGLLIIAGFVLFLSLLFTFNKSFSDRLTSITNLNNASNIIRLEIWRANWHMFLDRPLFGVGLRQNRDLLQAYFTKIDSPAKEIFNVRGSAHNNYFGILSTTGVFGFLSYMLLHFLFLKRAYSLLQSWPKSDTYNLSLLQGLVFSTLAFHLCGLTESTIIHPIISKFLYFNYAAIIYYSYKLKLDFNDSKA